MALLNGEVKAVVNDCMVTIRCVGFLDLTRIRFQTPEESSLVKEWGFYP